MQSSVMDGLKQNVTVNGTRAFQEKVYANCIRIYGNGKFQNGFMATKVLSHGSLKAIGNSIATELKSKGHSQVEHLQIGSMHAVGSFVANQVKAQNTVEIKGRIHIREALQARKVSILQQSQCRGAYICAEESLYIKADRLSLLQLLMLRKSRGEFTTLQGCNVSINDVSASYVIGENVEVGANCKIKTLIYSKSLVVAAGAAVMTVTHLPEQEKIWEMKL